jgi:hypothetical protein
MPSTGGGNGPYSLRTDGPTAASVESCAEDDRQQRRSGGSRRCSYARKAAASGKPAQAELCFELCPRLQRTPWTESNWIELLSQDRTRWTRFRRTHNPSVAGSSPARPIALASGLRLPPGSPQSSRVNAWVNTCKAAEGSAVPGGQCPVRSPKPLKVPLRHRPRSIPRRRGGCQSRTCRSKDRRRCPE